MVPAVLWATQLYQPLWETVVLHTAIVLVVLLVSKRQPPIWGGVCACVCVCVSICEMVVRTEKIERQREAIKKVKERMKQCV